MPINGWPAISISATVGPLLAIDGLVTYYMLIWTSYFIVILSSLLAVVELVRWITIIVKVQGIFVPGSSAMWFYAIFTCVQCFQDVTLQYADHLLKFSVLGFLPVVCMRFGADTFVACSAEMLP